MFQLYVEGKECQRNWFLGCLEGERDGLTQKEWKKNKKKAGMERTKRSLAHCLVKPELQPRVSFCSQQAFWLRG